MGDIEPEPNATCVDVYSRGPSNMLNPNLNTWSMPIRITMVSALSVLMAALIGIASAQAATVTHGLDTEFSGGSAPASGVTPYVTITFDDSFGGPNTVRLTIENTNLTGIESNVEIYLNFDPNLDASALTVNAIDNSASVPNSIQTGNDAFKADGGGFYDILFDMPPPSGQTAVRFSAGESIIYDLTFTSAIDASSFDFLSVGGIPGNGDFLAAAHITRIGPGGDSGFIGAPIPEPTSALLIGLGLLGLGTRRRSA